MKSRIVLSLIAFSIIAAALTPAPAAEPKTLEEALLNYPWEWRHHPRPADLLVFTKDGLATCPRFSWHWRITGPRTALAYDATEGGKRMAGFKCELTFDEDFTSLTGGAYTGKRLPAGAALLPATSTTGDLLQPGSVWNSPARHSLTITGRDGQKFRGRLTFPLGKATPRVDVEGVIRGNEISWLAKDAHPLDGDAGGDNIGTIAGRQINVTWHRPDAVSGTYRLTLLPGTAAPSAAPSTARPTPSALVATDANQARIAVLKDQAPNAVQWALAPLEQSVPPDIRQNLTVLLEDLLDEGSREPKAATVAYKAGEQLCRGIITVLDERKQALAAAGYRTVEADARTGVSSQALEARRNYKMSWPQYAREESQRAELKSQAVGSAAVLKERPKLEWAQRSAAMQRQLDVLYGQFRDALRQPVR
jgi:hypothetical protein